jgi:hypothetical protein
MAKKMTGLTQLFIRGGMRPAVFIATVGHRYLYEYEMPGGETWLIIIVRCHGCEGTGTVEGKRCSAFGCWGRGWQQVTKDARRSVISYLEIPEEWKRAIHKAGAIDRLKWRGRGEPGALSEAWEQLTK